MWFMPHSALLVCFQFLSFSSKNMKQRILHAALVYRLFHFSSFLSVSFSMSTFLQNQYMTLRKYFLGWLHISHSKLSLKRDTFTRILVPWFIVKTLTVLGTRKLASESCILFINTLRCYTEPLSLGSLPFCGFQSFLIMCQALWLAFDSHWINTHLNEWLNKRRKWTADC